jgi:hypothetical protein
MTNWRYIFGSWEYPEFQEGDTVSLKEPEKELTGKGRIMKIYFPGSQQYKQLVKKIGFPGEPTIVYNVMFYEHPMKPSYLFFENELVGAQIYA